MSTVLNKYSNIFILSNFVILSLFSKCWKSSVRESDGTKRGQRGCAVERDQARFYCKQHMPSGNATSSTKLGNNSRIAGQFHTECCHEDFCNGGPLPILQDADVGEFSFTLKYYKKIFQLNF